MGQHKFFSLSNLLDYNDFENVQKELSDIVPFSVVTVNTDGQPISRLSNFTSFCQLIRSSEKGKLACIKCDKNFLEKSILEGRPLTYTCHCGIRDCAAPIIFEGIPIGGVLGGQVLTDEDQRSKVDVEYLSTSLNIEKSELIKALNEVPVVTEDYIKLCLRFYTFFAKYITEKGYQKLTEDKLANEKIERYRLEQIATRQLIKKLQAQMNPHFLFNALNSIARIAFLEEAKDTEESIYNLAEYLHYTIKNSSETSTIKDEVKNLEHFIIIQNLRFSDKIKCNITVDESLYNYRIPSMTLQPLVENCYLHGLKNCTGGGIIKVDIFKDNSKDKNVDMHIEIFDNGEGVPQNIIDSLNKTSGLEEDSRGLGLINTHLRIKKMYGEKYGITIKSKKNEYSLFKILIPPL